MKTETMTKRTMKRSVKEIQILVKVVFQFQKQGPFFDPVQPLFQSYKKECGKGGREECEKGEDHHHDHEGGALFVFHGSPPTRISLVKEASPVNLTGFI